MNLKGLHGLKKFKTLGIAIGLLAAFFFASFVYAELTSFGSQPRTSSGVNDVFIHGWSDYNRALLNLSDTDIKNNTYDNYTCNATMCTWYAYLDNDNYTKQRGQIYIANFSKSNVYFNDTEGAWRNVSDLSFSQGVWNYSSAQAGYTADADTVLLLKFDETSANVANDTSRFGNNASWTGTTNVTRLRNEITNSSQCVIGNCLSFDGVNDFVDVGNDASLDITNAITTEAWVKLSGDTTQYSMVVGKTGDRYELYFPSTNTPSFYLTTTGGAASAASSLTLSLNTWYHLIGTYDSVNGAKIYVNGVEKGTGAAAGTIASSQASRIYIGSWSNTQYRFNGTIDEVKIINRSLTSEEVRAEYYRRWNTTTINYELGAGDGYDAGIRDVKPTGSYWLDEFGNSLETGLAGYWKFAEGAGATTADASGYGNAGTWTGTTNATWNTTGKFGNALQFDGSDDLVEVPDNAELSFGNGATDAAFTVSAWIKKTALTGSTAKTIISKFVSANANVGSEWELMIDNDQPRLRLFDNSAGAYQDAYTSATVSANTWQHIAATYDGTGGSNARSGIRVYLNGVPQTMSTDSGGSYTAMENTATPLTIGARGNNTGQPFDGTIDDVRIYSRAITADEIKRLYDSSSIKLRNDFLTVDHESYLQTNITNYTGQNLFSTPAEEVKVDGSPISNIYTPANGSHTTFFLDQKDNEWKVWTKENYGKGLVGWWKFDDAAGQVYRDSSPLKNDATSTGPNNPTWNTTHGKFGNALQFDGVNDFISANNLSIAGDLTVSGWFRTTHNTAADDGLVGIWGNGAATQNYLLWLYQGDVMLDTRGTSPTLRWSGGLGNFTADGAWHYLAGTVTGTTRRIYFDGVEKASDTGNALVSSIGALQMGTYNSRSQSMFNGTMDEVKIWNRSLTAEEIRLEYENRIKQGAPDFNDPRFKEQFKWAEEFKRDAYPSINITYSMTAADPFVRTMVDANATGEYGSGEGVVGAWHFNEGSGSIVYDDSGFGNTGTWTGTANATWNTSGKFGNALTFDGVNDFIDLGKNVTGATPSQLTITGWLRFTNTTVDPAGSGRIQRIFIGKHDASENNEFLIGWNLSGLNGWAVSVEETIVYLPASTAVPALDNWDHYAFVIDPIADTTSVYKNGVLAGTSTTSIPSFNFDGTTSGTHPWNLGQDWDVSDAVSDFFQGSMDEVRVYNRSLSAAEVSKIYEGRHNISIPVKFTEPKNTLDEGLVLYAPFEESSGTSTYDYSGYKNTGTLTNMNTSNPGGGNGNWTSGWNASGRFGNALLFDGVNDYVSLPNSFSTSAKGAISMWINVKNCLYANTFSIDDTGDAGGQSAFYLQVNSACNLEIRNREAGAWDIDGGGSTTLLTDKWYHAVWQQTGSGYEMYLNGAKETISIFSARGTVANTGWVSFVTGIDVTEIGGSSVGTFGDFNGTIDEVRIYNRSLSAQEITQLYYIGQTKIKPGNYYYNNVSSESVLWTAQNFREAYRGKYSEGLESLFNIWSNSSAKTARYDYQFNSTNNQHFLFSEGYTNSINAAAFNPSNVSLGFSSETLEAVVNSSLTYYNLEDNDLVLWLKMNEGWGSLNASDSSKWGNNGILTNINVTGNSSSGWNNTNCKTGFGFCMNFDGLNDYIDGGEILGFERTNPFSVSLWFKPIGTNFHGLVSKMLSTGNAEGWLFSMPAATSLRFQLRSVNSDPDSISAAANSLTIPLNEWQHFVVTYDGSSDISGVKIYQNGVSKTITTEYNALVSSILTSVSFNIGARDDGVGPANGSIDDVKIWRRTLSADEIKSMYQSQSEEYPNYFKADKTTVVGHTKTVSPKYDGSLAGWWKFDEGSGTGTGDASGTGNNGTLTNMNTTAPGGATGNTSSGWNASGRFGNALQFDGVDDYVNASNAASLNITDEITVEAWIKPAAAINLATVIAAGDAYGDSYGLYQRTAADNQINFYFNLNGMRYDGTGGNLGIGAWNHVVGVFQGTKTKVYLNGVDTNVVTGSAALARKFTGVKIGYPYAASAKYFNGTIDEVKIYPRALSADEIKQQYLQTHSQYYDDFNTQPYQYVGVEDSPDNGLVGYWKFDEASGTSTKDESGLGNTGTWTNAANNATWNTSGKFGTALSFDGVDDFVGIADAPSLNNFTRMTVSYWMKGDVGWGGNIPISKDGNNGWYIQGNVYIDGILNGTFGSITTGVWYHLAFTYDGTAVIAYTNGVNTSYYALSGTIPSENNPLVIGAINQQGSYPFNGTIDEVKIFNRSLTAQEIYNDYTAKNAYFNKRNATAGGVAHVVKTLGNQTIINYNLTDHDSAAQYDYDQRLLKIEGRAVDAQPHYNITSWPAAYSSSTATWFNISVEPCAQWCNVTLEANFTGVNANFTLSRGVSNQFYTNITTNAGVNQYRYYVRTSDENWRATDQYTFTQPKATPILGIQTNNSFAAASGTVLYLSFDENTTAATAYDQSGFGNDATWTGANNVTRNMTGKYGNALTFDGTNDFVDIGMNVLGTSQSQQTTITGWMNFRTLAPPANKQFTFIGKHDAAESNEFLLSWNFSNVGGWMVTVEGTAVWFPKALAQPTTNAWDHYAFVIDTAADTTSIYKNGVLAGTNTTTIPSFNFDTTTSGTHPWNLGQEWDGGDTVSDFFDGSMDEVRIYNYSMTADEINASARGVWNDIAETYPNATNVTGFVRLGDSSAAVNLTRNGTRVANGTSNTILNDTILLAAGIYQYNATYQESQNFTAYNVSKILTITQGVLTGNLYINGSQAAVSYVYGQIANATATTGSRLNNEGTLYLLRNGTPAGILSGSNFAMNETLLGASLHNFSGAWVGANYTFTNITYALTIAKAKPVLIINNNTASVNSSGLVGYWRFEQSNGSAATNDSSGSGNTGTLTNMNLTGNSTSGPTLGGRFGSALLFDGINDRVSLGNSNLDWNNTDFTATVWANMFANKTITGILGNRPGDGADWWTLGTYYGTSGQEGEVQIEAGNGASQAYIHTGFYPADRGWQFYAVRKTGRTLEIFLNGMLNSTSYNLGTRGIGGFTNTLTAGEWSGDSSLWNGTIDEVKIWNRSLSADEIQLLYQSTAVYGNTTLVLDQPESAYPDNLTYRMFRNTTEISNSYGLVGYWKFDNDTRDSSGMGNTGTMGGANATPANGRFGEAYSFDGKDDFVNLGNPALFNFSTGDFTLSAWVKTNRTTGNHRIIDSYGDNFVGQRGYILGVSVNKFNAFIGAAQTDITGTTTIQNNVWYHVALVRTGNDAYLYVNGAVEGTKSGLSTVVASFRKALYIGAEPNDNGALFNGTIDEVRIYNRSLSASEITEMYNQTRPAGYEYYLVNTTGNANYTAQEFLIPLNIIRATPTLTAGFNVSSGIPYGEPVLVYGNTSNQQVQTDSTLKIYLNGTQVKSGTGNQTHGLVLWAGISEFNLTSSEVANYSASSLNRTSFTVAKSTPILALQQNNSFVDQGKGSGLVAYWTFDENTSATAYDSSGYGNDGTITGAEKNTSGRFGNALTFGAGDVVSLGDKAIFEGMNALTVEAWVNYGPSTGTLGNTGIVTKWYTSETSYILRTAIGNPGFIGFSTRAASTVNSQSTSQVNDSQWHHIAGTYDGANQRLYIDGVLQDTDAQTGTILNSEEALCIGDMCNPGRMGTGFNGTIDEVRIYNYSMSADEINASARGIFNDIHFTYGQPSNTTAFVRLGDVPNIVLYRNTTNTGGGTRTSENLTLPAGIFMYNASYPETQNYTGYNLSKIFFVERATPILGIATNNSFAAGSGTVLYLSFDENASSAKAYDQSGFGNDATWTGANNVTRNTSGRFGNALTFNGTNQFITIANATNLQVGNGTGMTISAWVNIIGYSANEGVIAAKWDNGINQRSYLFTVDETGRLLGYESDDGTETSTSSYRVRTVASISKGVWTHVATVETPTSINLYIDGVNQSTTVITGTPKTIAKGTAPVTIGAYLNSGSPPRSFFNGTIDEVRIYNYSMTEAEINASARGVWNDLPENYPNATNVTGFVRLGDAVNGIELTRNGSYVAYTNDSALVGWWHFDEANAVGNTVANDSSGWNNAGTLVSGVNHTTGKFGNALSFDKTTLQFVNVTPNTAGGFNYLKDRFSVTAWVNVKTPIGNQRIVQIDYPFTGGNGSMLFIDAFSNAVFTVTHGSSQTLANSSAGKVASNEWAYIAGTYDGDNVRLYVNGTLITNAQISNFTLNATYVSISSWQTSRMNGTIDEVKIYNRTLTAAEITAEYQRGLGQFSELSAAGIYQYNVTYQESQNYSAYNVSKILTVTRGNANITVTFNTSSGFAFGDPLGVWANITPRLGDQLATVVILQNSTEISRAIGNASANRTFAAGIYNFSAYYSESQNWTNATATNAYFTIQKATPILGIQMNNSFAAGSGTVLYLSFDENTTQTARDQSGFGNDATWTGANNVTHNTSGRFGNALYFDGIDDMIQVSNDSEINNVFYNGSTITAWINPDSVGDSSDGFVIGKSTKNTFLWNIHVVNQTSTNMNLRLSVAFSGGTGIWTTASREIDRGQFSHIAIVYDADLADNDPTFYVDGVSVSISETSTPSGSLTSESTADLFIGNDARIIRDFNGLIDEVRIYNYSMTAAEINASARGVWNDIAETYPNATNVTGFVRLGDSSAAVNLTRNGTRISNGTANIAVNESILLAAGIYQYNITYWESQNYTAWNVSKILTITQGNPSLQLFLNGSQADVSSYVYGNPTNATAFRTSILYNNEGTLQLWRNGTSLGTGGPGNVSELTILPAGPNNYSAILINVANYTYSNVSYVMSIQKATPILGIQMNNSNATSGMSGSVLYLSFDENTTGISYDQSGFGNDATWTGGANNVTRNLTGRFGNAMNFDGVDDSITVARQTSTQNIFNNGGTVEMWINPNNAGESTVGYLFSKGVSGDAQYYLHLANVSGSDMTLRFLRAFSGSNGVWDTATRPVPMNQWSHIAVVYNDTAGNDPVLYVNGVSVSISETQTPAGSGTSDANAEFFIGNSFEISRTFNGLIDEVKIYNYSRSADEINASARGVWNDIPLLYHTIVNTTGFVRLGDSSAAVNLTRNGTRISNGTANIAVNESILLAAGIYQYNITYWESQNYSAWNVSKILTIPKAQSVASIFFNGTNGNNDYNRSDIINATGFISTPLGFFSWETKTVNLTFNYTGTYAINYSATGILTGTNNTIYNITQNDTPGAYNFTLWFDGDQNYSASSVTRIANVYGNLWVGLINPSTTYYAYAQNITLNVTVRDFLRNDEIDAANVSMNLTSLYANKFRNVPYYSRNVSMLNINDGNYSGSYNVTDMHAGNYSLNYTAARAFYRTGRNFTTVYVNESTLANMTSMFVNVTTNVTQNQGVLVNGTLARLGNIEINGTLDITIKNVVQDNVGLIVANASALDAYEYLYNSTLTTAGYNVTLVDDDTVNANTWTPSLYNVIVWAEASYDNFFMQYIDNNVWSQVVGGKPLVMTYYGMIKGAVDLNLSTGWGGRFQRDVNVKVPHAVTGSYNATNVSEVQDITYNSLYLFDFRGTELADDGTSGRTIIGVNNTNSGRIVVYGPYRATYWTAEAKDVFLRSVYWAIYGAAQTTYPQTQNITVPYTFEDHFNESDGTAEGWNATIGSWIVQNDVYIQTVNTSADASTITKLKNNSYWSDYTVSLRFNMLGGVANNTQIYFRYQNSTRYYVLNISSNGEFAIYKNNRTGAVNITDSSANTITISQDTWYTLNITARESGIDAEIDGLGRINATDNTDPIVGGTIALGTHRSSARFDDVAVYHHDGGYKGGTYYFKREWGVGTQAPGTYRATATFTYYNDTGNRTILASSVDFNITSNLTAQINITLNSTLLTFRNVVNANGNVTAGGNLAVTGNFTLSVWNATHEITNFRNLSVSVTPSSLYTINDNWNSFYNKSGNYSVRANYTWVGGSVYERANFTISFNVSADVNITLDAPKYNSSRNVTANVTVNNPTETALTTLTIACSVNDYNGALVASATTSPDIGNRTIGAIGANAVKANHTTWNVSANNAGTYSMRCNVTDASGLLGFDVRTFDITRINATLPTLTANKTSNYTVNDAVGIQGNITAVGGINVSGRLVVEVYNASQRIEQTYSQNVITSGVLNYLNITNLNLTFRTYKNFTGTYTLNASFNYTNETGSQIVRSATTQFNISSNTNATIGSSPDRATYGTSDTAVLTTTVTSTANEAITNGNLTIYIFNSTTFTSTYRQYWNSTLLNISAGGSATQSDTVNLAAFFAGTHYIFANFTFGGQNVNATNTFAISVIVPTANLSVKFFIGDGANYMVYTTTSGEVPANKTNATTEWNSRWIVSFFNDSVAGFYGTGGGVSTSASNTTTEHRINVNGLIRESRIYAIVTQGTRASFQNRAELLDQGAFTTQINPSFGYPLRDKNLLSLKLKYTDIDVQGTETLAKGTYKLRVENNGTANGKTLIRITVI